MYTYDRCYRGYIWAGSKIIGYAHDINKAILVIVNKWDLVEKDDKTMDKFKKS